MTARSPDGLGRGVRPARTETGAIVRERRLPIHRGESPRRWGRLWRRRRPRTAWPRHAVARLVQTRQCFGASLAIPLPGSARELSSNPRHKTRGGPLLASLLFGEILRSCPNHLYDGGSQCHDRRAIRGGRYVYSDRLGICAPFRHDPGASTERPRGSRLQRRASYVVRAQSLKLRLTDRHRDGKRSRCVC